MNGSERENLLIGLLINWAIVQSSKINITIFELDGKKLHTKRMLSFNRKFDKKNKSSFSKSEAEAPSVSIISHVVQRAAKLK